MKSKETKRKESAERVEKWQALTPQQQLDLLDAKLGNGIGAKKQRAKLAELLPKPEPEPAPKPVVMEHKRIKKSIPNGSRVILR